MIFKQVFDQKSSTYTYIIASAEGREALIIDPVLDNVEDYIKILNQLNLKLVKVIDTHIHADHVTGAGKLRDKTKCVTIMGEHTPTDAVEVKVKDDEIIKIDIGFISDGIELKKYISSGNNVILNMLLRNCLKFSTYIENVTPKNIPKIVAEVPIERPTRKKILIIDLFKTPIDFKIAISRVLFLTKIVNPEIMLKAATIIIKDKIINITFLSTFNAENKGLFISIANSMCASKLLICSSGVEKFLLKSKPVSPIDLTKSFFNKSLISLKAAVEYSFALCGCIPAVEIQVLGYL